MKGRPFIDETGNKYGKLEVIKFTRFDNRSNAWFLCRCTCGNEIEVRGYCLRRGDNIACGCSAGFRNGHNHPYFKDKTGMRFGLLVVEKFNGTINGKTTWLCKCDCGEEKVMFSTKLNRGANIKSCGCLVRKQKGESAFNTLFGHYKRQAKNRGYSWELSKEEFRELTKSYCAYCGSSPNNTKRTGECNGNYVYNGIDRVNNNRGYEKGNVVPCCGWCNSIKRTYSINEFKEKIVSIYNHWAKF